MTRTRSLCRLAALVAALVALSVAVLSAQDRPRLDDDEDVQSAQHQQTRLANKAAFRP